jgi:hypothetical protein
VPVVVSVLLGLCLVWTLLLGITMSARIAVSASQGVAESDAPALMLHPFELLVVTVLGSAWLWVPAVVLTSASTLWVRGEKARLGLVVPVVALLLGLLPWLGWQLTGTGTGIEVGAWVGIGGALPVAVWVFWHDLRAGARRARALA